VCFLLPLNCNSSDGQISDFGLSRESSDDSYYVSRGGALPVRWTAPEVQKTERAHTFTHTHTHTHTLTHALMYNAYARPQALEHRKFSPASDCWAFGILLYEIWTRGKMPYEGLSNQKVWVDVSGG
jgi:serine/threonine protein kinase